MKKFLIYSDIHLEFNEKYVPPELPEIDGIIIAGDLHIHNKGIEWLKKYFKNKLILYVLGNHEYYGYDINDKIESKYNNIKILEKDIYNIDKNNIVLGTTLWTDFNLNKNNKELDKIYCQKIMNDYGLITNKNKPLTPNDIEKLFYINIGWLDDKLKEYKDKTITIITHHLPSENSISPLFKNNKGNPAFASNLEYLMYKWKNIKYWIHGHTHDSFDYYINKTRVICNPRGYPHMLNKNFNNSLIINI